jgi:hypothetical protein
VVVAVVIAGLPGAFLTPTVPQGDLFSLWTPELASVEVYEGRVLSAEVGGVPLPNGRVPASRGARAPFLDGSDVRVVFEAGPPPPGVAPIVRVVGNEGTWDEVFELAADDVDLVVRFRYGADELGLERPQTRVWGALAAASPGDTIAVTIVRLADGGRRITVDGVATAHGGPTAGSGWSLLHYPRRLPDPIQRLTDLLWLFALLAPLGWWAPSVAWAVGGAALPLGILRLLPFGAPIAAPPPGQYAAVLLGVAFGLALRRVLALRTGDSTRLDA